MRFMIGKEVAQGDTYGSKNDDFLKIFEMSLNDYV